jgi:hypothetical protein
LILVLVCFLRAAQLRRRLDELPAEQEADDDWLPATAKKCPRCAEEIKLDAVACRHCGHEFDPAQVQRAAQQARAERAERLARMATESRIDELRRKRTAFLILGWLSIGTCILFWLGPILLWKAHQLGQELRQLQELPEAVAATS